MKDAIWAIFHHIIKADPEEEKSLVDQHAFCPRDEGTWCRCWLDILLKNKKYSEANRLPRVFNSELKPIFHRLCDNDLLGRYLKGLTHGLL